MTLVRTIAIALALAIPVTAIAAGPIIVHRDPGCGCCEKWVSAIRAQFGRQITIIDDGNRTAFQKERAVPVELSSCHTALIDGMTF